MLAEVPSCVSNSPLLRYSALQRLASQGPVEARRGECFSRCFWMPMGLRQLLRSLIPKIALLLFDLWVEKKMRRECLCYFFKDSTSTSFGKVSRMSHNGEAPETAALDQCPTYLSNGGFFHECAQIWQQLCPTVRLGEMSKDCSQTISSLSCPLGRTSWPWTYYIRGRCQKGCINATFVTEGRH